MKKTLGVSRGCVLGVLAMGSLLAGCGGVPDGVDETDGPSGGETADDEAAGTSRAALLRIPSPTAACPTFVNGTMTFKGQAVRVWKGATASGGSVVIYWHGTASSPTEAVAGLGQAAINEITAAGGIVAAQQTTTGTGTNTGNGTWFTGDFAVADEIVACANQRLGINRRRVFTAGFSAGGLQAAYMGYARSRYVAAVLSYSGGLVFTAPPLQDATETPSVMGVHGASGVDQVIVDFYAASRAWTQDMKNRGAFAVDCNHNGNHTIPSAVVPSGWRFLKNHPFNVSPEPYAAGLPGTFPGYCAIF